MYTFYKHFKYFEHLKIVEIFEEKATLYKTELMPSNLACFPFATVISLREKKKKRQKKKTKTCLSGETILDMLYVQLLKTKQKLRAWELAGAALWAQPPPGEAKERVYRAAGVKAERHFVVDLRCCSGTHFWAWPWRWRTKVREQKRIMAFAFSELGRGGPAGASKGIDVWSSRSGSAVNKPD